MKETGNRPYILSKIILPIEIGKQATLMIGRVRYNTDPVVSIDKVSPKFIAFRTQMGKYSAVPVDSSEPTKVEQKPYQPLHANCA